MEAANMDLMQADLDSIRKRIEAEIREEEKLLAYLCEGGKEAGACPDAEAQKDKFMDPSDRCDLRITALRRMLQSVSEMERAIHIYTKLKE